MTKEELLATLRRCRERGDREAAHVDAEEALLDYINDPDIREAYETINKWYA
jgi:hypothetical protein